VLGSSNRYYYPFNGQMVAMRDNTIGGAVFWLHGDLLGSVTASSDGNGNVTRQVFGPWGQLRAGSGSISQTSLNYTGQRLDATGLLYYHARYYDPALGRFISPDSVVPGAGGLTITPSDATAAALFAQGSKDEDGHPTTPQNPQDLNRYTYANNNPVRYTDPSGHCYGPLAPACAAAGPPGWAGLAATAVVVAGCVYVFCPGAAQRRADAANFVNGLIGNTGYHSDRGGSTASNTPAPTPTPNAGGGVQTTSKTLYNKGGVRIDVENPNPAQRPGQVHVQTGNQKYIYDPLTGAFRGAPKSVQKLLENKEILDAVQKGVQKYLGISKWRP
jgi:RHS repeat-associated protein